MHTAAPPRPRAPSIVLLGIASSLSPFVVAEAQYCDLKSYLPGDILVKVDRLSMAHSLEVRSPLLDYRIAELGFRMPTERPRSCSIGSRVARRRGPTGPVIASGSSPVTVRRSTTSSATTIRRTR